MCLLRFTFRVVPINQLVLPRICIAFAYIYTAYTHMHTHIHYKISSGSGSYVFVAFFSTKQLRTEASFVLGFCRMIICISELIFSPYSSLHICRKRRVRLKFDQLTFGSGIFGLRVVFPMMLRFRVCSQTPTFFSRAELMTYPNIASVIWSLKKSPNNLLPLV